MMPSSEWPTWARQDEAPIAVCSMYEMFRRPDGDDFDCAVYADGTVLSVPEFGVVSNQTPERVRQIMAALEFPGDDYERLEWAIALRQANARPPHHARRTPMSDALQRLIIEVEAGSVRPYVIEEMAAPMFHHSVWPNIAKSYGGDLNAAKSLHDAILPEWNIFTLRNALGQGGFEVRMQNKALGHPDALSVAATASDPARAWLLSILRAYHQVQA